MVWYYPNSRKHSLIEFIIAQKDEQVVKDLEQQRSLHAELAAELAKLNGAPVRCAFSMESRLTFTGSCFTTTRRMEGHPEG
jgi:hypothetical protein